MGTGQALSGYSPAGIREELNVEGYSSRPRVLIVDDAPENIQLLTEMLQGYCLPITASNGLQALKLANDDPAPDVILLDILMPGMSGYEVCTRLKAEQKTQEIPIIFVTALKDKDEEHKGLELGAADYITRPFNANLVKTRIRYQLEIKRYRALHDGAPLQPVPALSAASQALQQELSERKRLQEELLQLNQELEASLALRYAQLAESAAELAATREELRRESLLRSGERQEAGALQKKLAHQGKELENVKQELEGLSFSISHDLRAPLRHLLGFSSALLEDYADKLDDTAQSFLGCITKAAHKMELQIEGLLALSRVSRHELTVSSVDLSQLVRQSAASLQGAAPERQAVFTIADNLQVRADATLLRAAIDNLLGNAWKYTGKRAAAQIEFGQKQEGDSAVFYLRDNGAGFDMKYADRLFGAFQRMHKESEFEGTGVGLATVQRIIRRHGGRVWADAEVDGGATFFFTLSD
jgi:signal transduction histidine kinase